MISPAIAALADSALLLPASALLLLYLLAVHGPRMAAAWMTALGLAGLVTLGAKLLFHACGSVIVDADVVSPSGHASFAVIFYGALAILIGTGRPLRTRLTLVAATVLLALAVAVSRVRTGAHTVPEVLIGLAIGAGAVAVFAFLHRRVGSPAVRWQPLAAGFGLMLLLLGGLHFSLEHRIGEVARYLSATLDVCGPAERFGGSSRLAMPR